MATAYLFELSPLGGEMPAILQLAVVYDGYALCGWQLYDLADKRLVARGDKQIGFAVRNGWTAFLTDDEAAKPFGARETGRLQLFPIHDAAKAEKKGATYEYIEVVQGKDRRHLSAKFTSAVEVSQRVPVTARASSMMRRPA